MSALPGVPPGDRRRPRKALPLAVAFLLLILAWPRSAAPAATATPAIRLIAEAEDFTVERGDWRVVPYGENLYASTFAVTFLSRKACLGAPAQVPAGQEAVASQVVTVPRDGQYQVLARYEQPWEFSVEFTLVIEQAGRPVFRRVFGRLEDPKIWGLGDHTPAPMRRFWWGNTDDIVWQHPGAVSLRRGPATLRLIAGPQRDAGGLRERAAPRNVDVIVLTDDVAGLAAQQQTRYLPYDGWLVQDGDLFVRVTNPEDAAGPCVPVLGPVREGQHSPYDVHVRDWPTTRVLRSGRLVDPTPYRLAGPHSMSVRPELLAPALDPGAYSTVPPDEYLRPGERSGWIPLGGALDALNDSQWFPREIRAGRPQRTVDLVLELAVPDGKGGLRPVRTLRLQGPATRLSPAALEIPGDVAARPRIRTELEALQGLLAEVARFPWVGPAPKRFRIYGLMGFSDVLRRADALGEAAARLALALGDDTLTPADGPWLARLGVPERRTRIAFHWPPARLEASAARAERQGLLASLGIVSYGDEIRIPSLAPSAGGEAAASAALRAWLGARGAPEAASARFTTDPKDPWYYASTLYAQEAGIDRYREATRWIQEHLGKDVLTGANYSPHANYLVDDLHWVRPFREGALTLPWSEDYVWQVPEFSPQVVGYLVTAFRAGIRDDGRPILMYVMPHVPGNVPRDFRLSFYTAVAHGAKMIDTFCATPSAVGTTENYVATDALPMWRAIHRAVHEAGVFEDYVMDGRVRPASVGLLLSSVDEILSGDRNDQGGIHNQERKALYYALRQAQVPVDFLTEDDLAKGDAARFRLIYLTQEFLGSGAVAALTRWVEGGGTLVALAGGGFRDERGRPSAGAARLYGVTRQTLWKDPAVPMILAKQDLPILKPVDHASWPGAERVPVLAWKQTLVPDAATVLGRFEDGSPAVLERRHGKGRAVLFAFLPGLAYLKSGLPLRPVDRGGSEASFSHFLPTGMDTGLRRALVDAFLPSGFVRPVEVDAPLVEATLIETPAAHRTAIPLVNFSGTSLARVVVRVPGLAAARVRSVVRGPLTCRQQDGALVVSLPLDTADMLLVDER